MDAYKPLRHKIFAHTSKDYFEKTDELWETAKNANIESMIGFLTNLKVAIRDLYNNGHELNVSGDGMDSWFYEREFLELLGVVKGEGLAQGAIFE